MTENQPDKPAEKAATTAAPVTKAPDRVFLRLRHGGDNVRTVEAKVVARHAGGLVDVEYDWNGKRAQLERVAPLRMLRNGNHDLAHTPSWTAERPKAPEKAAK